MGWESEQKGERSYSSVVEKPPVLRKLKKKGWINITSCFGGFVFFFVLEFTGYV